MFTLALQHSTEYADSAERIQKIKQANEFIEREGAAAFLRISLPGLFAPSFREQGKAVIDALITSMKRVSGSTLIQYYRAMIQRPDRSKLLEVAPYPVMFIIGQEDEIIKASDTLQLADITRNAYIHVLNNVGHMSMLEAPESFASLLLTFMQL